MSNQFKQPKIAQPVGNFAKSYDQHAKILKTVVMEALNEYIAQDCTPPELLETIELECSIYAKRVHRPWEEFFEDPDADESSDPDDLTSGTMEGD